ncbi:CYTH domain-containing protein [Neobacillus sp. 179-C4.2 HS]|jgi:uncharacterized protein YjbK|uniref:CYTH domain-containing protein n=1 Tax=Neobacillus driksii TaxID=3035913 RepID=A0ABV4YXD1_9BACI|nr:CYTH domain-containing protein [Neobacillus sp. 179.-C4.2 HS]MDP5192202.1 CYTH domain-containing protein [Neobacillus sp. 179.-C4.2 HS]
MSETIEIEFKNLLTKVEYEKLLNAFNVKDEQIICQTNHYFDTPDFTLKDLGSALRIREKKDHYEMTLKQPADIGLLETTQTLSKKEFLAAINTGILPKGIIQERLEQLNIPFTDLEYFGSLTTKRAEFPYNEGLLVLDHSLYLNTEDFEIEYEVLDFQRGQVAFKELLEQYNLPIRITPNKIARFYLQKI